MAYLTNAELTARLKAILKATRSGEMSDDWAAGIVPDSNVSAQNEITGAFLDRRRPASDAAAWFRAAEFNADIGLWWCGVKGHALFTDTEKAMLGKLDRRAELREAVGRWLVGTGAAGRVAGGRMNVAKCFPPLALPPRTWLDRVRQAYPTHDLPCGCDEPAAAATTAAQLLDEFGVPLLDGG